MVEADGLPSVLNRHFSLLVERLEELGTPYGSLPVHAGLWESALQTSHSLFARLAIVALVHEARGLDTNPTQIKRCRNAGDERTAEVLEVIHADELTHVAAGTFLPLVLLQYPSATSAMLTLRAF